MLRRLSIRCLTSKWTIWPAYCQIDGSSPTLRIDVKIASANLRSKTSADIRADAYDVGLSRSNRGSLRDGVRRTLTIGELSAAVRSI